MSAAALFFFALFLVAHVAAVVGVLREQHPRPSFFLRRRTDQREVMSHEWYHRCCCRRG